MYSNRIRPAARGPALPEPEEDPKVILSARAPILLIFRSGHVAHQHVQWRYRCVDLEGIARFHAVHEQTPASFLEHPRVGELGFDDLPGFRFAPAALQAGAF